MINGKKGYKILLNDWEYDLDVYVKEPDDFWTKAGTDPLDIYAQNGIWNNTINDCYFDDEEDWYKVMSKGPSTTIKDYCWTVYPAVAIGDLVEVRETAVVSVIVAIGDSGLGDTVYQISSMDGDMAWVQRPQLRKIL